MTDLWVSQTDYGRPYVQRRLLSLVHHRGRPERFVTSQRMMKSIRIRTLTKNLFSVETFELESPTQLRELSMRTLHHSSAAPWP